MAINPALTANERAALAGVSTLTRYLSPVPDTLIATARVNQVSFVYPLAQLTVDGTSGWSDVQQGMTVYIGSTSGGHEKGIYRVRLTPGSTTLYLQETSSQDPGEIPIGIRSAGFADNDYVTVLQRWDIFSVLPTINPATGQIYEDYNRVVGSNNTTPEPLVNVVINNRRNHLATLIPDGTTFALEAVATPTSWPTSSGETFDYAWGVPASGWSNVTGDTTDTLNADVDPGNYVLLLNVTGSLSSTTQRVIHVHIHDNDVNPPLLISEMPRSDTRDRTGRRISFDLYSNRLESIPDGAMVLYFEMATWANQWVNSGGVLAEAVDSSETDIDVDDGSLFAEDDILLIDAEQMQVVSIATDTLTVTRAYNGTTAATHADTSVLYRYAPATDVPTATRQMAGWVQRQDKSTANGLRQAALELISPSYILGLLNSTSQVVQAVSSPATWQQVKPSISTASFLAWYMLRWRCANVLLLFNYTPFSVAASGQRLPSWTVDKGTVLQQIQLLATDRGNFGCDSEGEFYFLRNPLLQPYPRSGTVVRDELDASLYQSASNPRELQNRVQQVRGEAFSWNGSATLPTPYYADAPTAPGQGTAQTKLPAQVVTDQDELNQLTGDQYSRQNNPYPAVNVRIQKNRDVYEPAQMEFVEVAIPADLSADGTAYTANTLPSAVTKIHNADGTADMDLTGEGETHGVPGTLVPVPVGNDSLYTPDYVPTSIDPLPLPSFGDFASVTVPAAVPSPQGETVSTGKGAIWVSADGLSVGRTFDITVEPPVVEDITPTGTTSTNFVMIVHDKAKNFSRGAFLLGNDGTDSTIIYTTDVYADTVQWVEGGTITGIATLLESVGMESLAGGVNAYAPASGASVTTYDFTIDQQGWAAETGGGGNATYVAGVGWGSVDSGGNDILAISIAFASVEVLSVEVFYSTSANAGVGQRRVLYPALGATYGALQTGTGTFQTKITNTVTTTGLEIDVDNAGSTTGQNIVSKVIVTFSSGAGDATVFQSEDYGATINDIVVGTSPGATGAFCMSRFGPVSLAAVDAALEKATVFGGAYAAVTGGGTTGTYPIAARIPWFQIGKPGQTNNGKSPDFYLASAALVSGESLWKVIAGTKTDVTPSITGTEAVCVSANGIGTYASNRICFIAAVSGLVYVFSSKNSGTTWVHTQIDNAIAVRAQRFSPSGLIWILAAADALYYSDDGGVTWESRTVAGGALFSEIFG